ncbi:methionine aminotransferase [Filimonas effusa]|uniref:Aminotransferase class I/II-fold pyridoxal phosphate-dependent enzyme n=1 Tax=Filimonas effusa TaxID=2508721 RepID=A0A4Q1D7Y8_9BACT|nr:methionine aminotransferase [Filimonas effusa]RXK83881.1 aminotransferase class I/II-fold pyridoxal phosphate-dependent enzyme [Filimonas effusa]
MTKLISKLPDVGTTIFTVMSQLAASYNAVNLGQGFPDFPMDSQLTDLVNKAMKNGFNQYAHTSGFMPLREKVAEKAAKLYQANINADTQITITPGGTYAIYTAITTVLQPGDEVIVFEPAYDSYVPNIVINGAVPVFIPLRYPSYSIPWEEVKQKVSPKTRMIIINSPHNPTGSVLSADDMQQLQDVTRDTDIFIVSDEVYEHLIFDNIRHESVLRYPELLERSFVCFSFGKTYHCTGWKLGYCISSPALMAEFRKVHQFNSFSSNTPVQVALAEFLQYEEAYLSLGQFLQHKRDYFLQLMEPTGFKPLPSHGSYFQCFSYGHMTDMPDRDFAIKLTKEAGVATIPVSAFYRSNGDHKVLRFCFAKKASTLETAAKRLAKAALG